MFLRNSKIENELKSLHALLAKSDNDPEREEIANDLVKLQKEKTKNWIKIDEF